jgi:hypothetical protein
LGGGHKRLRNVQHFHVRLELLQLPLGPHLLHIGRAGLASGVSRASRQNRSKSEKLRKPSSLQPCIQFLCTRRNGGMKSRAVTFCRCRSLIAPHTADKLLRWGVSAVGSCFKSLGCVWAARCGLSAEATLVRIWTPAGRSMMMMMIDSRYSKLRRNFSERQGN